MKINKYQLIERCTHDDYSSGTPRPILKQVYFDGETLRAADGFKAAVIHPTDIDERDKPGFISMNSPLLDADGLIDKWGNPLIEARKVTKDSDTITITVDDKGVSTLAGRFKSDSFDASTKYPDFAPLIPNDPGYLFTLDIAHLLDLADTLLDMQGKKGGRRHTGEGLEFYWSQTHPDSVTVKPMVETGSGNKDYGILMGLQNKGQVPMSGVLSPRASGVDNADSDLPSREEYQRILTRHANVRIERNALEDSLIEARKRVVELELQVEEVDKDVFEIEMAKGLLDTATTENVSLKERIAELEARHADVLIERDELRAETENLKQEAHEKVLNLIVEGRKQQARIVELKAQAKQQRGKWCDPVTSKE